jgi:hypothetical protein
MLQLCEPTEREVRCPVLYVERGFRLTPNPQQYHLFLGTHSKNGAYEVLCGLVLGVIPKTLESIGGVWFEESLHPKCGGASWVHSLNLVE